MDYKYSASTGGFYPADDLEMYGENLPTDLVDVDGETYAGLFAAQAAGLRIIADVNGHPMAADQPPPSPEQLQVTRDRLFAEAAVLVAPLQDAVELGVATPDEEARLLAWKQYRVDLSRLDLTVTPVVWPQTPEA